MGQKKTNLVQLRFLSTFEKIVIWPGALDIWSKCHQNRGSQPAMGIFTPKKKILGFDQPSSRKSDFSDFHCTSLIVSQNRLKTAFLALKCPKMHHMHNKIESQAP